MTTLTDRTAAIKAATRDIARDIEADLGKLQRFRGTTDGATAGPSFRDPGPDVATYEKQKADSPGRVEHTLNTYLPALARARSTASGTAAPGRSELLALVDNIQAVRNHDDAAALVATFEEN